MQSLTASGLFAALLFSFHLFGISLATTPAVSCEALQSVGCEASDDELSQLQVVSRFPATLEASKEMTEDLMPVNLLDESKVQSESIAASITALLVAGGIAAAQKFLDNNGGSVNKVLMCSHKDNKYYLGAAAYDQKDNLQWSSAQTADVKPGECELIEARCGLFTSGCTTFYIHLWDGNKKLLSGTWANGWGLSATTGKCYVFDEATQGTSQISQKDLDPKDSATDLTTEKASIGGTKGEVKDDKKNDKGKTKPTKKPSKAKSSK
ncbi:unnamed protein product [Polarella glacialis]|jgi:hypothetical protein|uniref:Uncharacterized protein n=2 Tax=Polarella glacialis TaxID=89957 RepID=A0A813GXP8_POLGL|nr:unnamed protein product [Polarella glacialis]CAE8584912.1 unnamed protein product [Polarella glacialis]CAE8587118.1 unnamed protein product [Polarella glacialis]CAE8608449.1 unnamed protein product [Polarella glacialis]CAE8608913.1 unnamed protein product [Polarella glacialis]|mmetsp:Transcript_51152/g.82958  ORF Transcript_51152/g.82958 Transcript_51152/m.82958 type:complete len:266 (+) Transcript_51152:97-894(+)|eukprot:CAMPEP_0115059020 /NCGR_PEP_ID=MMETSP0227-20121206/6676_1 /TAXON_ID=89957 /ORGANISM="Polarella glacialis, Strain CCMP 1383" /LENGTH=265 /DNA_ID=CAMNT_0002444077 /DNA_START=91 /DNA_END=888 /DNA_ORIENTATION=-